MPDARGSLGRLVSRGRPIRLPGRPLVGVLALLAGISVSGGCADTVRPVLGGLKIGNANGPFHVPVLETEPLPFEYPVEAWDQGVGGETILKIHIASHGGVDSVRVEKSSGHSALDSAAIAGALQLRYRPARQGDEAVGIWGYLPVRYPMPEKADPRPGKAADKP